VACVCSLCECCLCCRHQSEQALGLSDVFLYEKMECDDAGAIVAAMQQHGSNCGGGAVVGGSVTMPLKRAVMRHCALLSPAAACIGCVNTLSLQLCSQKHCANGGSAQIVGDNTDWAGMLTCLSRIIDSCSTAAPITCAVIIGSGATARSVAFALLHLPCITHTFFCNRTRDRAAALAAQFNVDSFGLDEAEAPLGLKGRSVVIISTVSAKQKLKQIH
jgi:shikimate 5-dehydrogenase